VPRNERPFKRVQPGLRFDEQDSGAFDSALRPDQATATRVTGEAAEGLTSRSLLTFDGTGLDAGTLTITLPMSETLHNDGRNGDG